MVVVSISEFEEGGAQFLEIGKATNPQQLLFEGAKDPFDASIAFRLADKRWRGFDTQEFDFVLGSTPSSRRNTRIH